MSSRNDRDEGPVQREGLVHPCHLDRIIDHGGLLAQVGQMDFLMRPGAVMVRAMPDRPTAAKPGGDRVRATAYWPPHPMAWTPSRWCGSSRATSIDPPCRATTDHHRAVAPHPARSRCPVWQGKVDTIEVRLALRCLIAHCPERWPLDMFWNSAGTDHDIGRAQGCNAALNGIVRQVGGNPS